MESLIKIKCPKCGWEYLPAEIFYPDQLLGTPSNIVKDEQGKILTYDNDSMNLKETFTCEHCGCIFEITGVVKFDTTIKKDEINFDEEYTTKIKND